MSAKQARPLLARRALAAGLLALPALLRHRPAVAQANGAQANGAQANGTRSGEAPPGWPDRPIRLVVGFGPGGAGDITARLLAPRLGELLGRPVVVENRPGAGSLVAAETVARAQPDGHTWLLATNTTATAPFLYERLSFDPARDFEPVSRVSFFDHVIAVTPGLPVRSLAELAAYARANPGRLNIGSISAGNATHLGAALLRTMLGAPDVTLVTYRSTPELLNATATGEVQVASEILPAALSQITGGRIRAIAVAAPERFARLPDVPTAAESGLPGYVVRSWNGIALPARTPRPIVERLNAGIVRVMALPEVREKLLDIGVTPGTTSPEEFRRFFAEEAARWARVIADAGIERQ
ncbi:tripartite tricarboxylate transporter substrate binding protein [Roseomonas sp. NAR14]|uniref:Tripartite tricarboxylate transporter substrate binding protein n=1 Tax=Roseomonas acroporae TaxID=2937791 RepID=A0A9X2BV51_9PROT|nr:tripartite tricarboxylate transporter substrate binding protein [Roseomonas acroporae]MCK8786297.1 tripartite tricarboxylate transporter substrate binding protein [Roseomonas acroporae]